MGIINRLDTHLSNMIAAGEVVERPSGIVKELVENSIDAKATTIEIQIVQGGIDRIMISDDGMGMDKEDAEIAFERHATSKLKEEADLWNIHTMGFRGEALPSIAAVSHVVLKTNNGVESTLVEIAYGEKKEVKKTATSQGTILEVSGLFQKTPARFKHLKSPQYEFSLISDIVQKFALAHPEIAFYLSHDGKEIFRTKGSGSLKEVLFQIYGRDMVKTAMEIDYGDYDYQIKGFAMQPNFNRATKYYMLFFINGRMVRNHRLQKAVIDAYHEFMPRDRYPIVVLNIEMDAHLVDVNVHPSKWEIRLSKERQLEKLLYMAIQEALKEDFQVLQTETKKTKPNWEIQTMQFDYQREKETVKLHDEVNRSFVEPMPDVLDLPKKQEQSVQEIMHHNIIQKPVEIPIKKELSNTFKPLEQVWDPIPVVQEKSPISLDKKTISQENNNIQNNQDTSMKQEVSQDVETKKQAHPSLPEMQVIGQFHNSYILAQGEAGLYIIDQHAAAERYHFEMIKKQILSGNKDTQPLLLPITIEVQPNIMSQLSHMNESFALLGIQCEAFGNSTLVIRHLPIWMKDIEEEAFIQDLIDVWIKEGEVKEDRMRHLAIATMACHSSIRFHRSLNMEEMKKVIDDLKQCEQPFHCPHGRPTFICMSDAQLVKEFLR